MMVKDPFLKTQEYMKEKMNASPYVYIYIYIRMKQN